MCMITMYCTTLKLWIVPTNLHWRSSGMARHFFLCSFIKYFFKKLMKKNLHLIVYNCDMFQECKIERDYVMKRSRKCEFEP